MNQYGGPAQHPIAQHPVAQHPVVRVSPERGQQPPRPAGPWQGPPPQQGQRPPVNIPAPRRPQDAPVPQPSGPPPWRPTAPPGAGRPPQRPPYGPPPQQGPGYGQAPPRRPVHPGPPPQAGPPPRYGPPSTPPRPPVSSIPAMRPVQSDPGMWPVSAPAAPEPEGPPPVKKRRGRQAVAWIVSLLILVGLGAGGWYFLNSNAPATAAIGDCVTQTGENDLGIVGCGEPNAQFKVVGKLENRTMIDAGLFACAEFGEATSSFWQGKPGPGELGLVLCLAPTKPV